MSIIILCREIKVRATSQLSDQEKFKSSLSNVIAQFERAREWADLSNCLQKVKKQIESNRNQPIPLKKDLAKRLAQCLNPDLNVIHALTLEVYNTIFQREIELMCEQAKENAVDIIFGEDLGLFYSGLFNFYQFAAFEVKRTFLKLITDTVLKLKKELILSLPGFMLCMLPALEDQNSDLLKQVDGILSETEKIVGTNKFFGEIWKAMLRTPRCALAAIKYLDRKIPREAEFASKLAQDGRIFLSPYSLKIKTGEVILEAKEGISESSRDQIVIPTWHITEQAMLERLREHADIDAYFYFFYPNKERLCNNSLQAGLSTIDQNVYVNRAVLDFVISHMPITGKINTLEENIRIVEAALHILPRMDFAAQKKFFTWFSSHIEEAGEEKVDRNDAAIQALIPALKRLLKKFLNLKSDDQTKAVSGMDHQRAIMNINTPIQIMTKLFSEILFDVEPILDEISVDLIRYVQFYRNKEQAETHQAQGAKGFSNRINDLFQVLEPHHHVLWKSLGKLLSDEVHRISEETSGERFDIDAIELITFSLRTLSPEKLTSDHDEPKQESLEEFCVNLFPIVSSLLSSIEKLTYSKRNNSYTLPALKIIEEILQMFDQYEISVDGEDAGKLKDSVQDFSKFFSDVAVKLTKLNKTDNDYQDNFRRLFETFRRASQFIYKIQRFVDPESHGSDMPDWLQKVIDCSTDRSLDPRILLVATEAFLDIIEYSNENDYEVLKAIQNAIIPQRKFEELKITKPYCTEIIKTLWSLLDKSGDHDKIVNLLTRLEFLLPKIFSDVVKYELSGKVPRETKHRAVKKFSIFWKITSAYLQYKPFEPNEERLARLDEDNKHERRLIIQNKDDDRSFDALHSMLQILEDQDPTMRLSCRSWLQESKSTYSRILDPLLKEFMVNNKVYRSNTGQLFFLEKYDTHIVIENFGKLRNIILNTQEDFIQYLCLTDMSDYIQPPFSREYGHIKAPGDMQVSLCRSKYIQIVVYITLQYIMSQAVESLDAQIYQETQTVNASACEFMELILKSVETYQDLVHEITHIIIGPLVRTLRQAILNRNVAHQVHLLNLLKVILFECNFNLKSTKKENREQAKHQRENVEKLFRQESATSRDEKSGELKQDKKNNTFIDCLCEGMKNQESFVRYHFISFAMRLVPYMHEIAIDPAEMGAHIQKFITCLCDLLRCADVSMFEKAHLSKHKQTDQDEAMNKIDKSDPLAFQLNEEQQLPLNNPKQKTKDKAINLVINQEHDIIQILEGLVSILHHCMNLNVKKDMEDLDNKEDQLKQLGKNTGQEAKSSYFWFFGEQNQKAIQKSVEEQIVEAVFKIFDRLIASCLHCWNDLDIFKDREFFFTRLGVFAYSKEDDKRMEKKMKQQTVAETQVEVKPRMTMVVEKVKPKQQMLQNDYVRNNINPIQRKIVDLLEPVAGKFSRSVVTEFLKVWLDRELMRNKNDSQQINYNVASEKLVQILLSLEIQPHEVLDAVIFYIEDEKTKHNIVSTKQVKSQQMNYEQKRVAETQALICHFVYTYLLFNISNYFKMLDRKGIQKYKNKADLEEYQLGNYTKLYNNAMIFFKKFMLCKNTNTICWLLEILLIVSQKFKPEDPKTEKKLKAEFSFVLDTLLKSAAAVIEDKFGTAYSLEYGVHQLCMCPTIYEMLQRYEFTSQKHIHTKKRNVINKASSSIQQKRVSMVDSHNSKRQQSMVKTIKTGRQIVQKQDRQLNIEPFQFEHLKFSWQQLDFYDQIPNTKESIFADMEILNDAEKQQDMQNQMAIFMQNIIHKLNYRTVPKKLRSQTITEEKKSFRKSRSAADEDVDEHLEQNEIFKFFVIITLRNTLVKLVQTIYPSDESDKNNFSLSIVVGSVLKGLSQHFQSFEEARQTVQNELLTDFVAGLSNEAKILQQMYKKEVSDLFYNEKFFSMSERSLQKWQTIMRSFMSSNDVFDELFLKFKQVESFFVSKVWEQKQKALFYKRLAFLVYSSEINGLEEQQLDTVLKKMAEGFKNASKDTEMKVMLFLLSRILMLRLSTVNLAEALRKLWPHLLNELVTAFDANNTQGQIRVEDIQLYTEGIKLIELMSQLNIEDFQMNQWMFLFDGYGLTQSSEEIGIQAFEYREFEVVDNNFQKQKRVFQPYLCQFTGKSYPSMGEKDEEFGKVGFTIESYQVKKEELLPPTLKDPSPYSLRTSSSYSDIHYFDKTENLRTLYKRLMDYTIDMQFSLNETNIQRTQIDRESAEKVVERDFHESEKRD